jgi:hypothetical protein
MNLRKKNRNIASSTFGNGFSGIFCNKKKLWYERLRRIQDLYKVLRLRYEGDKSRFLSKNQHGQPRHLLSDAAQPKRYE